MKSYYVIAILIFVAVLIGWFFCPKQQKVSIQNIGDLLQYANDTYGISFSYPSDYVVSEQDIPTDDLNKYHQITLINKNSLPLPVDGEGPTAITIGFYKNDTIKYTAESWARNSKESNLRLGDGRIATTTISGFPVISFRWSGLYNGTTIVLAKSDLVYTFNVTYLEMGDQIIQDFVVIRDSVKFSK